jgi:exopolysaccharide production protein ExoZ
MNRLGEGAVRVPARAVPLGIDGIQYLRGIAALMVVVHHARHYFPHVESWSSFGSRGVDIFFVISGFIMAHATQGYRSDHRLAQAGGFLLKRFVRVVPLYWLALLWTDKREFLNGGVTTDSMKDFVFAPHFHPVYTDSIFPSLVPGWTINYEMFFYALFAVSMLFGRRRFVVLIAAMASLVLLGIVPWSSAAAIFYTSSVLLEFLFGIGIYFLLRRRLPSVARPLLILITLVGFALLAIDNSDAARGYLDGPCAALIVGSTVLWAQGLKIGWLRAVGDASYSIYLFHLASFWIAGALLHRLGIEAPTALNVALVLASHLAIAIAAGLLIHRWVERPLLDLLRWWVSPPAASPR